MSNNYESKNYQDIFIENITDAQKYSLISDSEDFISRINNLEDIENAYVLSLSTHSLSDSNIYKSLDIIHNNLDINKATGEALDNFGKYFNLPRPLAQRSLVALEFSIPYPISQDITIPTGTEVTTDLGDIFITETDAIILHNTTKAIVNAYSLKTGYDSRVGKNTLKNMEKITVEGATVQVNNNDSSTGGKDAATDEEYRIILKNWTNILEKGTKSAYENYLNNFEGLDGYRLIPRWDGTGTIKIILDIPTESQEIIFQKIREGILENVQKYEDDDILVELVQTRTITNINCTVNVDIDEPIQYSLPNKEQIKIRVQNAIETFVNGGYREDGTYYRGLLIGQDFIPFQCGRFIAEEVSEVKNVDFEEDNSFTIGDYEKAETGEVIVDVE